MGLYLYADNNYFCWTGRVLDPVYMEWGQARNQDFMWGGANET